MQGRYHRRLSGVLQTLAAYARVGDPAVYHKGPDDWPTLNIQEGRMSMESINRAPFGVGFEVAIEDLTPAADWEPPIRP